MELSQLTTATPLLVLAIAILVSLAKPVLEATLLPPASALHDTGVRIVALVVGCLVALVASIALVPAGGLVTAAMVLTALIEGGKAALISVAAYHLLTANLFDGSVGATAVPLEPMQLQAFSPLVQRVEITHVVAPAPAITTAAAPGSSPSPIALPPGVSAPGDTVPAAPPAEAAAPVAASA